MSTLGTGVPLSYARDWLKDNLDGGAICPCCSQRVQIYRRRITAPMARVLIAMYQANGTDWVHLPSLAEYGKGGDEAKCRYWGLITASVGERPDGSNRIGWWRLTPKGRFFVLGVLRVPKYARVYNGRCLGLDDSETVTISDCLGTRFNYAELMAG